MQDNPIIVVRPGNINTEGKTVGQLEGELKAVKLRLRGESAVRVELELCQRELGLEKKRALLLEKEAKTALAMARRQEKLAASRGSSSMVSVSKTRGAKMQDLVGFSLGTPNQLTSLSVLHELVR